MGQEGKVIVLTGPSGTGKSTLAHRLLAAFPDLLEFSVSATTRPPRVGEQDGKDYYFLDEATFRRLIQEGAFLEWEEVYPGRFYGTLASEVERIWKKGKHALLDIDVKGAWNVKRRFGERALVVFVHPGSLETLRRRLEGRGTENAEQIAQRLRRAEFELGQADRADVVLYNQDLEEATQKLIHAVANFLKIPVPDSAG